MITTKPKEIKKNGKLNGVKGHKLNGVNKTELNYEGIK